MIWNEIVNIDKEILSGQAVFRNTRVPIESLFDYLENGYTVLEFINEFPTVKKEQAIALLEISNKMVNSKKLQQLYETVA